MKYGFDPGNKIELFYDKDTGRLKYILCPRNKTISYQYDENGKLTGVTDIRGYTTEYEYDEDNRMIKATYRGNEISYTYPKFTKTAPRGTEKRLFFGRKVLILLGF